MKRLFIGFLLVVISFSCLAEFKNNRVDNSNGTALKLGAKSRYNFMHGDGNNADFKWTIYMKYKQQTASEYEVVFATQQGSNIQVGLNLMLNADNDLYIHLNDGNDGSTICGGALYNIGRPAASVWHDLFIAYDSTPATDNMTIYVDGSEALVLKKNSNGIDGDSAFVPKLLGLTASSFADSLVKEARVYNVVLTAAERTEITNSGGNDNITRGLVFRPDFYSRAKGRAMPNEYVIRDLSPMAYDAGVFIVGTGLTPTAQSTELKVLKR